MRLILLTDKELTAINPKEKPFKVSDRDGLYVSVRSSGVLSFRFDYQLNGRRETLAIGKYEPAIKATRTPDELEYGMGRTVHVLPSFSIETGIRIARSLFPKAYIDEEECAAFLDCMSRYKRVIDPRTGQPGEPLHDDASHGADVWRYLGQAVPLMDNSDSQSNKEVRCQRSGMAR